MHITLNGRLLLVLMFCLVQQVTWAQRNSVNSLTWITINGNSVPLLRATLSDGKPRLFIVNTSATLTLIDRDVAKEAGLTASITDGKPTKFVSSPLNLGPGVFTLDGVPFGLTDLTVLRQDDPNIAGMLGMNVLSHFMLRMDYAKQQMDVTIDSVAALPALPKDVMRIPLIKSGDLYSVEANVDGHNAQLVINTGTDRAYLHSPDLLKSLKPKAMLEGFHTTAASGSGDGFTSADIRLLRLHSLRLAGKTWDNPIFEQEVGPSKDPSNALGNDFLKRFHVVLDFPGSILYLTIDPSFKEDKDELVGTGMTLALHDGRIIITGVFSPSSAKTAGLGEGDEIVSFEGHPLKGLTPEEVGSLFHSKKKLGETITLEVIHPNRSTTQSVKLQVKSLL